MKNFTANLKIVSTVFLFAVIVLSSTNCISKEMTKDGASWSKEASILSYRDETRLIKLASPDGKKTAIVGELSIDVMVDGTTLPGTENYGVTSIAELGWAPDSKAFFVTQSLGGAVGEYRVTIFLIGTDSVRSLNIASEAMTEFEKRYECIEPVEPNIGAVKWVDGSKNLLLVTEVPPHSICPEMGKLEGYIVAVPTGRIIKEFSERELRAEYGQFLGTRFTKK